MLRSFEMHAHPNATISNWQHDHSFGLHKRQSAESRTKIVVAITFVAMAVEITAGLAFGSMALLADGLHMGSHALALGISAGAYVWMRRQAGNQKFSFGTGKIAALGGYTGALLLLVPVAFMVWESLNKLISPVDIAFGPALAVAISGLAVNAACAVVLARNGHSDNEHQHGPAHNNEADHHEHGQQDHNLRAAIVHVGADAMTSVLAIFALLGAGYLGWIWLDPMVGLAGAAVVTFWAKDLIVGSSHVLLDKAAPASIQESLRAAIESDNDNRLSDLHVWSIGPGIYAAALAVVTHDPKTSDHYKALVPTDLGIQHLTIDVYQCPSAA
jgi:cation diffusion facilitator family transporter